MLNKNAVDWRVQANAQSRGVRIILLAFSLITFYFAAMTVAAKQPERPVKLYELQCNEIFSCPPSLLPRVGFWIEVFSRWDTSTAIFHDKDNPQRVYSTLQRKKGCRGSRKGDAIDRERKKIEKGLRRAAERIVAGKPLSKSERFLENLFVGQSTSEMRSAAKRIRCQSGNRDRMAEALKQFQLYQPTILDALESENLTPELQYLPFVESAFNPEALSHVGAAGLWQIMPATGRALGLTINNAVDQRYDPTAATYAAARYFRDSVNRLSETAFENGYSVSAKELNPFVITSYNYGVRGMSRAIKQVGLDYERLLRDYKSPNFQTAVKNFYASFLAARYVAKNTTEFFGSIEADFSSRIHDFSKVQLQRATSSKRLIESLKIDKDLLKALNPALKNVVWRDKALVPKGFELHLPYSEAGWDNEFTQIYNLPAEIERPGFVWHRVKSGQTACGIAERYRASCSGLRKLNGLNRKGTIYAGQRLKVPSNTGGISLAASARRNPSTGSVTNYRIQRGDSACLVANRHGMKCGEFLAINGLTRRSVLQLGQRVTVSSTNSWHTVASGQTACGIAERYRVRCSELLKANRLSTRSTIYTGQRLRIPHKS